MSDEIETNRENFFDSHSAKHCVPRFKVVKLVSSKPYRVGRWLCVEFAGDNHDHDSDQQNKEIMDADVSHLYDTIEKSGADRLQFMEGLAIDNKIEQAMDLVKSHLMFAVREEVDVLRDRIAELSARVELLEQENAILRAHASHETLMLLHML